MAENPQNSVPSLPLLPPSSLAASLSPVGTAHGQPLGAPACFNGFYWLGKRTQQLGVVGPGEKVEATLFAFFPSPGVFNVNKVRFRVSILGHVEAEKSTGDGSDAEAKERPQPEQRAREEQRREGGAGDGSPSAAAGGRTVIHLDPSLHNVPQLLDEKRLEIEENQWESELVDRFAGRKAVVGFPFECLVHVQPAATL